MKRHPTAFQALVEEALAATPISRLLLTRAAVVLERLASGGGSTNWYYCRDTRDLTRVASMLAPGSCVSFYFDQRIRCSSPSDSVGEILQSCLDREPDAFLGVLSLENDILIQATIVVSAADLAEELGKIERDETIFYGPFPARDNDGVAAVTVDVPDLDGVLRSHPH